MWHPPVAASPPSALPTSPPTVPGPTFPHPTTHPFPHPSPTRPTLSWRSGCLAQALKVERARCPICKKPTGKRDAKPDELLASIAAKWVLPHSPTPFTPLHPILTACSPRSRPSEGAGGERGGWGWEDWEGGRGEGVQDARPNDRSK